MADPIERFGVPADCFDEPFVDLMRRRMAVSYHKYGSFRARTDESVDRVECLRQRLQLYVDTGNTEWLVDCANFAMIEFATPQHDEAHYRPTDSHESPGVALKEREHWVSGKAYRPGNAHAMEDFR